MARASLALPVHGSVIEIPEDGEAVVGPVSTLHGAVEFYVTPLLHHLIPAIRVMNTSASLCNVITSIIQLRLLVTTDVTTTRNPTPLTCHMKEHGHGDFWFCIDLALVLPQVPLLSVLDLEGPGVGLPAVETPEPAVPCEGDHTAGQDVQGGFLYPGNLKRDQNQCELCNLCPQTPRNCQMNNLCDDNQSSVTSQDLFASSGLEFQAKIEFMISFGLKISFLRTCYHNIV